jgi:hypothetical protein
MCVRVALVAKSHILQLTVSPSGKMVPFTLQTEKYAGREPSSITQRSVTVVLNNCVYNKASAYLLPDVGVSLVVLGNSLGPLAHSQNLRTHVFTCVWTRNLLPISDMLIHLEARKQQTHVT